MGKDVSNYGAILLNLKEKIRVTRQKALFSVNSHLIEVYHAIGHAGLEQRRVKGWGAKVISKLSADLMKEFPDMKGFSVRNIKYMKSFAQAWPLELILQQTVAKLQGHENQSYIFGQHPVAQIPWGHHTVLLDKVKERTEREWYLKKTIQNGWSRPVLIHQIEAALYQRQEKATSNFERTLPAQHSDLVQDLLKSPYNLEFTGLSQQIKERELGKALIAHIQNFMLELGRGFAFVGNQINLIIDGDDYFPDLLFFNYHLNCFVVVELKVDKFKPEYAGKLNFYVNAIDDRK